MIKALLRAWINTNLRDVLIEDYMCYDGFEDTCLGAYMELFIKWNDLLINVYLSL